MPPTGQRPRMELRNFPSPNELSQLNNCLCEPSRAVMFPRWTDYKAVGIPIQATHWEDVFSQATAVTCCFHGVQFRRRIHQHVAPNPWKDRISIQVKRGCKTPLRLTLLVGFVVQQTERNDALDCEVFFYCRDQFLICFSRCGVNNSLHGKCVCVYIKCAPRFNVWYAYTLTQSAFVWWCVKFYCELLGQ